MLYQLWHQLQIKFLWIFCGICILISCFHVPVEYCVDCSKWMSPYRVHFIFKQKILTRTRSKTDKLSCIWHNIYSFLRHQNFGYEEIVISFRILYEMFQIILDKILIRQDISKYLHIWSTTFQVTKFPDSSLIRSSLFDHHDPRKYFAENLLFKNSSNENGSLYKNKINMKKQ